RAEGEAHAVVLAAGVRSECRDAVHRHELEDRVIGRIGGIVAAHLADEDDLARVRFLARVMLHVRDLGDGTRVVEAVADLELSGVAAQAVPEQEAGDDDDGDDGDPDAPTREESLHPRSSLGPMPAAAPAVWPFPQAPMVVNRATLAGP